MQRPSGGGDGRRRRPAAAWIAASAASFALALAPGGAGAAPLARAHGADHSSDHAATRAPVVVDRLRVDDLRDPLGIDDVRPRLSWQLRSRGHDVVQRAYELRAASSPERLAHPDLWSSGKVVSSTSTGVPYAGRALGSRDRVWWQARVWDADGRPSAWSAPAHFEVGLLDEGDWSARWIGNPDWLHREPEPAVVRIAPRTARYVRVDVTKLGLPIREGSSLVSRLQLAELVVTDSSAPDSDLARGGAVTASEQAVYAGKWEPRFLTDGSLTTDAAPLGYTSKTYARRELARSIWLTVDLGQPRRFDEVRLYPRTDTLTDDGKTPNFPSSYTVQTSDAADGPFDVAATVTDAEPPPPYQVDLPPLPLFAKQFALDKPVRSARLYATGVGVYAATVNGMPVADAVLEPPNTDYRRRVVYSTYDVTRLLRRGANALGVALGNGTFNVPPTPDRYTKFVAALGAPRALMQLEVTYADGTTERIASDPSWRTTLGPTTFGTWYGGEDYDARREQPGWDRPQADLSGWRAAETTTPPAAGTELSARMAPPIEPVERFRTVAVTEPKPGTYVFDLGTNFAGWEQLRLRGPAGTTVTVRPGERLGADGLVDQSTMIRGGDVWPPIVDHYTLSGRGVETWHPSFSYHGFRYVEVTGLPGRATADMVSGVALSAARERSGEFSSSSALLNGVHGLIDRSLQSNLMSIPTDCPDREKLGWLEEVHLQFGTLSRSYDVAAYWRDYMRTVEEAQEPSGLVPDIAPQYVVFSGDVHDEPNWGSAIVMAPWKSYLAYGDTRRLSDRWDAMVRYFDYLRSRASGNIVAYGLGDWGAIDTTTPDGVTATYAYHQDAVTLAKVARVLGKEAEARSYAALADEIADAFNARFLDAEHGTYANGTQASDALALDMGVVPAELRERVVDHLVASIRAAGDHLTVGEVALPALLRALSAAGRDDVVYDVATQTTNPSYGYQLVHGATSLTEYWDGPTGYGSQNHWMMAGIGEWLSSGLGGIQAAPDAVGYDELVIRPAVVGRLTHAEASYRTPYGEVRSAWRRQGRTVELDVTVPANSAATVEMPVWEGAPGRPSASHGARFLGVEHGRARYRVGSGRWSFVTHTREQAPRPSELQLAVNGPSSDVPLVAGEPATASFDVHNLLDRAVTVRPRVEVTDGFAAQAERPTLTIGAHETVRFDMRVEASAGASAAVGRLTVTAGDASASATLAPTDDLARIATMSASSVHSGSSPAFTNDGLTDSEAWSNGVGGWNDDTSRAFPDTLTATWAHPVRLARAVVWTLDSQRYPAAKYGIRDYDVEALVDGAWRTLASTRSNVAGRVEHRFDPVEATALRLVVHDSNDHGYSRVIELEAYGG